MSEIFDDCKPLIELTRKVVEGARAGAVEAERERWATILSTAKDAAIKNTDYPIAAALRDCWDAGTFQISPSPEPEPPEPMTIAGVTNNLYGICMCKHTADIVEWLTALVEAQARRDAKFIRYELKDGHGCMIPNAHWVADKLLESAGLG